MCWKEETIFTNNQVIIDADCRKDDLIVLLKGSGENRYTCLQAKRVKCIRSMRITAIFDELN